MFQKAIILLVIASAVQVLAQLQVVWQQAYNYSQAPASNSIPRVPFFDNAENPSVIYIPRNGYPVTGWSLTSQLQVFNSSVLNFNGVGAYLNGIVYFDVAGNNILAMNVSTGQTLLTFSGHTSRINEIKAYPDYLLSTSFDSTVKLWNITTGTMLQSIALGASGIGVGLYDGYIYASRLYSQYVRKYALNGTLVTLSPAIPGCDNIGTTNNFYFRNKSLVMTCQYGRLVGVLNTTDLSMVRTMYRNTSERTYAIAGMGDTITVSTYIGGITMFNITSGETINYGSVFFGSQILGMSWDSQRMRLHVIYESQVRALEYSLPTSATVSSSSSSSSSPSVTQTDNNAEGNNSSISIAAIAGGAAGGALLLIGIVSGSVIWHKRKQARMLAIREERQAKKPVTSGQNNIYDEILTQTTFASLQSAYDRMSTDYNKDQTLTIPASFTKFTF